jgi:predicted TIM-barrel enzyme
MRLRRGLDADVAILADLHVPYGVDSEDLRRDCEAIYYQGLADALVLPDADAVEAAKAAVPEAVMLCAGVRLAQSTGLLDKVRGVILDSALRADDDPLGPVCPKRAAALVSRLRAE